MKRYILACLLCISSQLVFAQPSDSLANVTKIIQSPKDTIWTRSATFGLNFNNVSLNNWSGGGQSALSFTAIVLGNLNYHKERVHWSNFIDLAYGVQRVGKSSVPFKKTEDRIYFQTKFAYEHTKKIRYAALADFRSQFADGYTYYDDLPIDSAKKISNFLAPAFVTVSLGIEYVPFKSTSLLFSPVSAKYTIVNNTRLSNLGAYGVTQGSKFREEYGMSFTFRYKAEVVKNVTFATQLFLFDNYKNTNVDVFWDCFLFLKVNKYLTTTFTTNLIYDDDFDVVRDNGTVGPAIQFKSVLAIGLIYKLSGYGVR
jgi:hypothetical protein